MRPADYTCSFWRNSGCHACLRCCVASPCVPGPGSCRLHGQDSPGHHRSHSDPSGAPGGTLFETAQIRGFWCIRVCVGTVRYGTEEHTVEKHVESRIWCEVTSFSEILGANKLRATDPASPHSGSYCRCRPASPLEEHHLPVEVEDVSREYPGPDKEGFFQPVTDTAR